MSDRAQRVLDALMEYDEGWEFELPIQAIVDFFDNRNVTLTYGELGEDYESLTVEEEKQIIKAFLERAY